MHLVVNSPAFKHRAASFPVLTLAQARPGLSPSKSKRFELAWARVFRSWRAYRPLLRAIQGYMGAFEGIQGCVGPFKGLYKNIKGC